MIRQGGQFGIYLAAARYLRRHANDFDAVVDFKMAFHSLRHFGRQRRCLLYVLYIMCTSASSMCTSVGR